MAVLVVGGVVRYALHQELAGRPVVNIWDVKIDAQGVLTSRSASINDQAQILCREWKASILGLQGNDLKLIGVSWVDLNSADGEVGSFNGDGDVSLPAVGTAGDSTMPGNVCVLIHKMTTGGRGAKNGRAFIAGLDEQGTTALDPNHLSTGTLNNFNAAFAAWKGAVQQQAGAEPPNYDSQIVVVHQPAVGSPTATPVSALVADSLLATQRRRLGR